jgi:hypothetical protein
MDVRLALLTILATVPLAGCPSTWNCDPPQEQFQIDDAEVSAAQLDELVAAYAVDGWDDLECQTVCRDAYQRQRGWEVGTVDSCELTLPENPDGSGEPGRVSCAGTGYEYFCEGRRPLGHVEGGDADCSDALGRTLAAMAYLEAASVVAFEQLAEQLRGWGAPAELIERCGIAASEERAHARWLTMLAARRGAAVPEVTQTEATTSKLGLLDVALHNAVEGCVHETFAALMAACRKQRATSTVLRRVFAKIAVDEAGHGQLAWDIHAWLLSKLAPEQAAAVDAAQQLALARLPERARELASLPAELGELTAADAEALARALHQQLAA